MTKDILVLIEHLQGAVSDISYVMLAQANALKEASGGEVIGVLLAEDAGDLPSTLKADKILTVSDPVLGQYNSEAYCKVLSAVIQEKQPLVTLLGDTTMGSDVAGLLSVELEKPLVSFCKQINYEGELQYLSQICNGRILAEGTLEAGALVSMIPGGFKVEEGMSDAAPVLESFNAPDLSGLKITFKQYVELEEEDIDISVEKILVAVGRGVENQDNVELAEELAEALNGAVCGSRPVIDQNWLPTSRLVGKSGKTVKPALYLAMGISGAPEHIETISGSEMIIAVNTDPNAPIFNIAKYGIEEDMGEFVEALLEALEEAK